MSGNKQVRHLVMGGDRALHQSQLLGSINTAINSISSVNAQVNNIVSNIVGTLNDMASSLNAVNTQLASSLTQLINTLTQLAERLRQTISAQTSVLRRIIVVYVNNRLDQPVWYELRGNITPSLDKSVGFTPTFTVSPNSSNVYNYPPGFDMWFPYVTIRLKCDTAPTTGYVRAVLVRLDGSQEVLVDNLEIRDTNPHDASTDPDKIKWIAW